MVAVTYAAAVAMVGMWPHKVDDNIDIADLGPLRWTTETFGLTTVQGLELVQVAANVLLFVPFGALVLLIWTRASIIHATIAGAATSALIELLQLLVRPERVAEVHDVIANTMGAAVGAGVVWVVRRRARHLDEVGS